MLLSRTPQAGTPQDQTETQRGPPVLHTPANREMCKVQCLQMQEEWPTLSWWPPLNRLLQQGPFPHPSTQGGSAGLYSPKARDERERNYCGGHQGCPNPLLGRPPGRLSPSRAGIFAPRPIQQCDVERSTGWLWRRPHANQNRRPQQRHTNGFQ